MSLEQIYSLRFEILYEQEQEMLLAAALADKTLTQQIFRPGEHDPRLSEEQVAKDRAWSARAKAFWAQAGR